MAWQTIPVYVLDDPFGYQSANAIRDNLLALGSRRAVWSLGGSRVFPTDLAESRRPGFRSKPPSLGPRPITDYRDVEIDGSAQDGALYVARVEVRTSHAEMSITPRVLNVTDGVVAGAGIACSGIDPAYAGLNQRQTITLTLPGGVKTYRLQFTLGAIVVGHSTWALGRIEHFITA